MEGLEEGIIQLELKYCERCGGLWLRPRGSDLVFCAACAISMAGLPAPRVRVIDLRTPPLSISDASFWTEGGNA